MRKLSDEKGFVLTEALAALALAAIVGAALIAALQSTSLRAAQARVRALALREAEAQMSAAVSNPTLEGAEGETGNLIWRRTITPYAGMAGVERVTIEVDWATLRRSGTTQLEGVRFAQNP